MTVGRGVGVGGLVGVGEGVSVAGLVLTRVGVVNAVLGVRVAPDKGVQDVSKNDVAKAR